MSRENYDAKKSLKSSKMKAHHVPLRQSVKGIELSKGQEGGEVDDVSFAVFVPLLWYLQLHPDYNNR